MDRNPSPSFLRRGTRCRLADLREKDAFSAENPRYMESLGGTAEGGQPVIGHLRALAFRIASRIISRDYRTTVWDESIDTKMQTEGEWK
jgi:hypothetical protein